MTLLGFRKNTRQTLCPCTLPKELPGILECCGDLGIGITEFRINNLITRSEWGIDIWWHAIIVKSFVLCWMLTESRNERQLSQYVTPWPADYILFRYCTSYGRAHRNSSHKVELNPMITVIEMQHKRWAEKSLFRASLLLWIKLELKK